MVHMYDLTCNQEKHINLPNARPVGADLSHFWPTQSSDSANYDTHTHTHANMHEPTHNCMVCGMATAQLLQPYIGPC